MANYDHFITFDGESFVLADGSELYVVSSGIGLGLITDRTQFDVLRAKSLARIGYANMTEAEKAEWDTALKGAYNHQDFNRVETAVGILQDILIALPEEIKSTAKNFGVAWDSFFEVPYDASSISVETKTDWAMEDIPSLEEKARYLGNVAELRSVLQYDTDELPSSMEDLTISGANAIEEALVRLNEEIEVLRQERNRQLRNTASAWYYSGDVYANEV